jgi:hypothetical protein
MDIIGYVTKLQSNVFQIRNDDDFADRLTISLSLYSYKNIKNLNLIFLYFLKG